MKLVSFAVLLITVCSITVHAVNVFDPPVEKVVLLSDRSIYITGEKIQFHADLIYSTSPHDSLQSKVLYCELITPDGNNIASGKYRVYNSVADGCMLIPGDIRTGVYYIRAYTRLMRNYGPGAYAYRQIRIVNPKIGDVLAANTHPETLTPKIAESKPGDLNPMVSIFSDKSEYSSGDSVKLSLHFNENSMNNFQSLCLKIVPENTNQHLILIPSDAGNSAGTDYFAETKGLSLNGKLIHTSSNIPVEGKKVNLSIIGDGRDFMSVNTKSDGRFFFALPDYFGNRDLFLCAEKTPSAELKIWVDNDFCTKPVNLPAPQFLLSSLERNSVQKMAVNAQINARFAAETELQVVKQQSGNKAFYGKPTSVLFLDEYIQLPTLEECFNELPSSVKVRKHQGEKYFKVIGKRDLSFYAPLVLVDWVAIDEPDKILAISPNAISRIEIVNEAYVKGGQTYGGIISIISKRGDFAGIDLPSTGIFVNYKFLDDNRCSIELFPDNPGSPDTRNTLFWLPEIPLKSFENKSYVVILPEARLNYSIVIEGITKTGEILTMEKQIEMK